MSRFDIAEASHTLSKPNFDLCLSYRYILDNEIASMRRNPRAAEKAPIFRFDELKIDPDFRDILWDMRTYVDLMELHCDGLYVNPDPARLATQRNLLQYRLLMMVDNVQGEAQLCLLAALIFSFGVTYPIPIAAPLNRLCEEMLALLPGLPDIPDDLLTWSLMLGCIASGEKDEAKAFRDALVPLMLEYDEWAELKDDLQGFLWFDRACDPAAMAVFSMLRQR